MEEYEKNRQNAELFKELKDWENNGRRIRFNGYLASPLQVVNACRLSEDCIYMKNYLFNQMGDVEEIQVDAVYI